MDTTTRLSFKELGFYWDLLDLSFDLEDSEYTPDALNVTTFEARTDFISVIESKSATYVVMTGSNTGTSFKSLVEWTSNLMAFPLRGFHAGYWLTSGRAFKKLKDYPFDNKKKVVFICHSRGIYGLLTAYRLQNKGIIDNPVVVSFGAPEPCKRRGVKKLDKTNIKHHRVYTADDFVSRWGAGKHWQTHEYMLPTVKGKLDHISYEESLAKAVRIEEEIKEVM